MRSSIPAKHADASLQMHADHPYRTHIRSYGSAGKIFSFPGRQVHFHRAIVQNNRYQDQGVVLMMRLSLSA
jgi:hypothetical protein